MIRRDFDFLRSSLLTDNPHLRAIICTAQLEFSFDGIDDVDKRERLENLQKKFLRLREKFQTGYDRRDFEAAYPKRRRAEMKTPEQGLRRTAWLLPKLQDALSKTATAWVHHGHPQRYAVDNPNLVDD